MAQKKAKPAKAASKSKSKAAVAKAKKPAAKKPAAKKPAAKKPVAKKPAAKKPAAKKPAAKKPVAKKVVQKKPLAKKLVPKAIAVKKEPTVGFEKKRDRKAPPKMKKMVVKPVPPPVVQEDLYENESKDFAFAFAESMLKEQQEAEARRTQDASDSSVKLPKRPTSRVRGESTLKFSPYDLAQFRKSLLALRDSIVGKTVTLKTNALEQTIDRAGEDEDGSDSFMRLQNLGQVGEQNKTLQKIEEALHRIEDGTYGICEVCGQLIRKPRLQHLPFAHTCMECQSAMESNPDGISS